MLRSLTTAILLICFLGIPTLARAQSPTDPDDPAPADRVYEAKDWHAAKSAYSGLTKKYPDNARFWFRLGTAQKSLGEFDAAVESFKRAETAGAPKSLVRYGLAETQAKKGNTAAAFSLLEEALAAGYAMPDQLSSDPDFSSLRSDTRFAALVERAKRAQTPCRYAPEHRQFDFWIGEWSVTRAKDESPAGDSRIELSLGDCVIVENWTSKNTTYAGKSYNVYNTDAKRWEQCGNDSFHREPERWRKGFLHRGCRSTGRDDLQEAFAVFSAGARQSSPVQPGIDGPWKDVDGRIRFYLYAKEDLKIISRARRYARPQS